jgi:pilus assembly protein Flp/PilA
MSARLAMFQNAYVVDMPLVVRFLRDESGATAIEYALIAGGIAGVIILVVQGLGTRLTASYQAVSDNLK